MRKPVLLILFLVASLSLACSHRKVESAKALYRSAREAQQAGDDLQAIVNWKAVVEESTREIAAGHYPVTHSFLRASAYIELGEWQKGLEDLKKIPAAELREEELWIYPLYSIVMGDTYSQRNMTLVADSFYESVLKKSSLKSSPLYLLALERRVNNSVKAIGIRARSRDDAEKYQLKEYESLAKEVQKYLEDFPHHSVPHYLLADLCRKTGRNDEALEHLIAALEMGLPTRDLQQGAEFELVSLLTAAEVPPHLKDALLDRAIEWWGQEKSDSALYAGVGNREWADNNGVPLASETSSIRYLAVRREGDLKVLLWKEVR